MPVILYKHDSASLVYFERGVSRPATLGLYEIKERLECLNGVSEFVAHDLKKIFSDGFPVSSKPVMS